MKNIIKSTSRAAFLNPRLLIGFVLGSVGLLLAVAGMGKPVTRISAGANPVPLINQPLVPAAIAPGGPGFTLTVNGTGFVPGSVVNWNSVGRATIFVSSSQVTATILASDVAIAKTGAVTVANPSPGGGLSNTIFFPIGIPASSVGLSRSDITNIRPGTPIGIATADFNRDGNLDLAVSYGCCAFGVDDAVSILLGNGDGTFQPQVDYATAGEPNAVAAGDFNGDGNLDLVTSDYTPAKVSVLLGNGDGTFRAHTDYATRDNSVDVIVGDFNRDGKLDLATSNPGPSSCCGPTVSILFGNGDGTFQAHVDIVVGAAPTGLATGDFNHDGNLDLAVAKQYSNNMSILLGEGDGTFQSPVNYATGSFPGGPVAADFNADGTLDLAVNSGGDNTISVLLGNGDGTFKPRVNYTASEGPGLLKTADFNADGVLDLVVNNSVSETISLFLGNGDGTFRARVDYPGITGGGPSEPEIGDFNGDGSLDLAFTYVFGDVVSIFLQRTQNGDRNCLPPPIGLVSWWAGDRDSSDLQGTNPGDLKKGASFAKGEVGPAFFFDGADDYVQVPHNASLNPGMGDFSVEFWMKTDTLETQLALLSKRDICNAVSFWGMVMLRDGTVEVEIYEDLTNINTFPSDVSVNDGIWHNVALVRQNTTATLYIDGAVHGSGSTEGITNVANTAPVRFATDVCVGVNGSTQFYSGELDEIQYFNLALTSSEVQEIYNAGAAGECKPEVFVQDISPYAIPKSGGVYKVGTTIQIVDALGHSTPEATVRVTVDLPEGGTLSDAVTTDADGTADYSIFSSTHGKYVFKVERVRKPGRQYSRESNVETQDRITVP